MLSSDPHQETMCQNTPMCILLKQSSFIMSQELCIITTFHHHNNHEAEPLISLFYRQREMRRSLPVSEWGTWQSQDSIPGLSDNGFS